MQLELINLVMLDGRERIVEVMQEQPPFLILGRLAKPNGMIFQPLPLHQ